MEVERKGPPRDGTAYWPWNVSQERVQTFGAVCEGLKHYWTKLQKHLWNLFYFPFACTGKWSPRNMQLSFFFPLEFFSFPEIDFKFNPNDFSLNLERYWPFVCCSSFFPSFCSTIFNVRESSRAKRS